jgi:thioredoxin-like negative regulator of GroEL
MLNRRFYLGVTGAMALVLMSGAMLTIQADESAAKAHGPIAWTESLAEAQKRAAKEKKLIVGDFWAEWCGPCKQMLATTYKDKAVVARSKEFVPVLVNVDKQEAVVQKYNIGPIPAVIFMDAKGKVVLRPKPNTYTAKDFLKLMDEAQKKAKK